MNTNIQKLEIVTEVEIVGDVRLLFKTCSDSRSVDIEQLFYAEADLDAAEKSAGSAYWENYYSERVQKFQQKVITPSFAMQKIDSVLDLIRLEMEKPTGDKKICSSDFGSVYRKSKQLCVADTAISILSEEEGFELVLLFDTGSELALFYWHNPA